jgi:hypothetical protein
LSWKAKEKNCRITKGNSSHKDSLAGILDDTTLKVLSFALEIRVGIAIIKCDALDNKVRESTNTKTKRGTILKPVKGLVVTSRIIKEMPWTHRPGIIIKSPQFSPTDASSVEKLVIMPKIAQSTIHRHPRRTTTKGLTRIRLPMVMCRIKISRTNVKAE